MALSEEATHYRKGKFFESVLQEGMRQLFTLLPVLFLTLAVAFSLGVSNSFAFVAMFIAGIGSALYYLLRSRFGLLSCVLFVLLASCLAINLFYYRGESILSVGWILVFLEEISFNFYGLVNPDFISETHTLSTAAFLVLLTAVAGWLSFYYRFIRGKGIVYLFFGSFLMFLMLVYGNPVGLLFVLFLVSVILGMPLEKPPAEKFDTAAINDPRKEKFWNIKIAVGLMAIVIALAAAALLFLAWLPPASAWWPAVVEAVDRGITIFYANDFRVQLDNNPAGAWLWVAGEIILLVFLMVTVMTYRKKIRPLHVIILLTIVTGVFLLRGLFSVEYLSDLPLNIPLLFLRSAVFMFLAGFFFIWRPNLVPLALLFFFFLPVVVSPGISGGERFSGLEDIMERIGHDDTIAELFEEEEDPREDGEEEVDVEDELAYDNGEEELPGFSLPEPEVDEDNGIPEEPEPGEEEGQVPVDPGIIEGLIDTISPDGDEDISGDDVNGEAGEHEENGLPVEMRDEESAGEDAEYPGLAPGEGERPQDPPAQDGKTPGTFMSFLSEHLPRIVLIVALLLAVVVVLMFYPYVIKYLKGLGPLLSSLIAFLKHFLQKLWSKTKHYAYKALPAGLRDHWETLDADPDRREYYRQLRFFSRRYPRLRHETPREYGKRLLIISAREEEKRLKRKQVIDFQKLTLHFEKVRYR